MKSPAQLLMSRTLKTRLPTIAPLLQPQVPSNAAKELRSRQRIQKKYHNVGFGVLPPLHKGDVARMRRQGKWLPVTVIEQHRTAPQSYLVQTPDGRIYRRNRRHLLRTNEGHDDSVNDDLEEETDDLEEETPHTENLPNDEEKCIDAEGNQGPVVRKAFNLNGV